MDNIISHRVVPGLAEETQPSSSRDTKGRGRPTSATHDDPGALQGREEQVHARIMDHLREVSAAFLPTMDEESGTDDEALA